MVGAARGVLGCREAAGDCASEALVQALEMNPADVANLEAFLVTIAKRRAVDMIRREARARRRERLVGTQYALDVADVAEDVTARAEARWIDDQARALLRPHVYELVQLVADGMEIEAAAAQLGMSRDAASSHLKRARAAIRTAFAKTILGLAAATGGLRRLLLPTVATSTMAGAAFAALLAIVVAPEAASTAAPELELAPATDDVRNAHQAAGTPAPSTPRHGVGSPTTAPSSARRSTTYAQVQTPTGGVRLEERDDGQANGDLVSRLVACSRHIRVDDDYIGCEDPGRSPT
jgi:RNA polymerase sigma factor (sigma-70 family)